MQEAIGRLIEDPRDVLSVGDISKIMSSFFFQEEYWVTGSATHFFVQPLKGKQRIPTSDELMLLHWCLMLTRTELVQLPLKEIFNHPWYKAIPDHKGLAGGRDDEDEDVLARSINELSDVLGGLDFIIDSVARFYFSGDTYSPHGW